MLVLEFEVQHFIYTYHLYVTTAWLPMVQLKLSRIYSLASITHQDCFYMFRLGVILVLMSVVEQEREDLQVEMKRDS